MLTASEVVSARDRIGDHVRSTPVAEFDAAKFPSAGKVWMKLEFLQHTGSFKARGAFNRILKAKEDGELSNLGVVAASGGNFGVAVAYAAAANGVPALIYVPETSPGVKVERLRRLGADVVQFGSRYADALEAARKAAESGALFCHAYDQEEVCAGAGTLGLELIEQTGGALDTVLVSVGGGGLIAGVAAALEGQARVVGVEPSSIPTLNAALAAMEPVDVEVSGITADSLGASRLGDIAFDVAVRTGVISLLVEDRDVVAARNLLWDEYRIIVEHGTAVAFAALLTGIYQIEDDERVAVVLCGANTALNDLSLNESGMTY